MKKSIIIIAILYSIICVSAWWIFDSEDEPIPRIDIGTMTETTISGLPRLNINESICSSITNCQLDNYDSDEIYINEIGNSFTFNETKLNETIDLINVDIYVNESGDIMNGNLNMSDNNITQVTYIALTDGNFIFSNSTGVFI